MKTEYYHTTESVAEYIQAAKGFDGKALIEKLKKVLPEKATVLEIGSGPGKDWEILSNTFTVTGSDNSDAFLNYLKQQHPAGEFINVDASKLIIDKTFDGIYSNKVMHHLKDDELERSIKRQLDILNPNGIICHSFWKGEGSEIFKGFVNYHDESSLNTAFTNHFDIIYLESYAEFEENDSLLLIAKKK
ncbi:class I SAM-dependent methyltransferase [Hyunsoonleella flava]|uniref:Class I SAM-dependent methyltransferase n=1 Tax=Hyunsoonleella flava TaxID=2527939 RepID=A0A4Q9FFH9_9FLAO|nr:class I SAM-dependent methyltransferase [Hyunsoonleella flava]TBN03277.1 class I SAM-dependent methyltransferase [Hyunsoonleella flava]